MALFLSILNDMYGQSGKLVRGCGANKISLDMDLFGKDHFGSTKSDACPLLFYFVFFHIICF